MEYTQGRTLSNGNGENVPKLRFPGFEGEWRHEKLSDFTERITRKNVKNETQLPLTISSRDGLVDQISYFNKTVASKDMSSYYLLNNGEYAYNKSYSVGYRFGSIKRLDRYSMGALSTLYICFSLKKHNSDFIKIYFDSLKWYPEIHMIAAEGARNHGLLNVATDAFFQTKHWLPPINEEQKKIVVFFELINLRVKMQQKLVDTLKLYKRGLLAKLFPQNGECVPQYRFAGFTDAWEQRKLGEVVSEFKSGVMLRANEIKAKEAYPVYGGNGLRGYTSTYNHDGEFALIGRQGALCGNMNYSMGKAYFTEHAVVVQADENNNTRFIYYLLDTMQLGQYSDQSAQPGLAVNKLIRLENMFPDKSEQVKISTYFERLDRLITLHQEKYSSYEKIKFALLQRMFI